MTALARSHSTTSSLVCSVVAPGPARSPAMLGLADFEWRRRTATKQRRLFIRKGRDRGNDHLISRAAGSKGQFEAAISGKIGCTERAGHRHLLISFRLAAVESQSRDYLWSIGCYASFHCLNIN